MEVKEMPVERWKRSWSMLEVIIRASLVSWPLGGWNGYHRGLLWLPMVKFGMEIGWNTLGDGYTEHYTRIFHTWVWINTLQKTFGDVDIRRYYCWRSFVNLWLHSKTDSCCHFLLRKDRPKPTFHHFRTLVLAKKKLPFPHQRRAVFAFQHPGPALYILAPLKL